MTLAPGFRRIPKDVYLSDPCERPSLTASVAKRIVSRSPMHGWDMHPRNPSAGSVGIDPSEAMRRGLTVDSLLLGGDQPIAVVPRDGWTDAKGNPADYNGNLKSVKEWKAAQEAEGKLVVSAGEMDDCMKTASAIRMALLRKGVVLDEEGMQQTAIWEKDGVLCRCRFDHLEIGEGFAVITELKTTENASIGAVTRTFENFGYDIQAAAYVEAVETLRPDLAGRVEVRFIFAETLSPYAVRIPPLAGTAVELGRLRWARAKFLWREGIETGAWLGYGDEPLDASLASVERAMLLGGDL